MHHGHPGAVRWVKNIRHSQTYPSPRNTLRTVLAEHSKSATLIPRRLQPLHPFVAATRQLQVPLRLLQGPVIIVPLPPAAAPASRCWVSTRSRWRSSGGWPLLPASAASPPTDLGRPSGEAQGLPLLSGPLQTIPGTALDGLQFLVRHPGGEHGQDLPEKTLGAPLIGLQVAGPLSFRLGQGTNLDPAVPESADGPDGVLPSSTDAVDGRHHQGIAAGQAVVQTAPSTGSWVPVEPETPMSRNRFSQGTPALRS